MGLTSSLRAPGRGHAAALHLLSAVLLSSGCGLFDNTERREMLNAHKLNSKIFYERGDFERAEDQCRKGLKLDSGDETLRLTLAYTLLRKGGAKELKEADSIFASETGMFSDDWRLFLGWGMTQQALQRQEPDNPAWGQKARANLEKANRLNPDSIEANYH